MPIRSMLEGSNVFSPEDVAVIAAAFEDSLRALGFVDRSDPVVTMVAKRIIAAASAGERDDADEEEEVQAGVGTHASLFLSPVSRARFLGTGFTASPRSPRRRSRDGRQLTAPDSAPCICRASRD